MPWSAWVTIARGNFAVQQTPDKAPQRTPTHTITIVDGDGLEIAVNDGDGGKKAETISI